MAYVDQDKKARIAAALKQVIPQGWKHSLSVRNHSTIVLTIAAAPVNLPEEYRLATAEKRAQFGLSKIEATPTSVAVNHHNTWELFGESAPVMAAIVAALNTDNYDKSDLQTDYHNVGHYVDIHIGRWNKPFIFTGSAA